MELKVNTLNCMTVSDRTVALEKGSASLKLHLDKMLRKKVISAQYHKDKVDILNRQMLYFKSGVVA